MVERHGGIDRISDRGDDAGLGIGLVDFSAAERLLK
jgi:hypothetical protein